MRHCLGPLALLALAACSGDAPADDPEETAAATDPLPAPVAEETTLAPAGDLEGEPDAEGNRWFYKADSRTALFGPPQSEGVLAIGCGPSTVANDGITITRYTAAQAGGAQSLVFARENASASVQVSAESMELGPDYIWQGSVEPPASDLRRVFAESGGPVTVSLESGDALEVPSSEAVVRAIEACT